MHYFAPHTDEGLAKVGLTTGEPTTVEAVGAAGLAAGETVAAGVVGGEETDDEGNNMRRWDRRLLAAARSVRFTSY